MFGKDRAAAQYEKKIREMERLLRRKEVETALLRSSMDGREGRDRAGESLASISTGEICYPNHNVKPELRPMRWRFAFLHC